jgi:hypothetical protein
MKVYLDGTLIQDEFLSEGLRYPTFTLRKQDETGERAFSFTNDITFTGPQYTYLYAQLVSSASALDNKITLKFVNDCCAQLQTYEFYITFESLKWCENSCELHAVAIEKSDAHDQLNCLKNTLIWDDYAGFKSKKHPRFAYCNEMRPSYLQHLYIIFAIATLTSLLVLVPLIISFGFIVNFIVILTGNPAITPADLLNYYNLIINFAVGCGRKHPSPLVRDYADNVCNKCGVTFKSSILKNPASPYHNTCYHNAPVNGGTDSTDTTTFWIEENAPILNGTKFLNQLKGVFNADYKIQNNILEFERRDYFIPTTPWLDLTTYDSKKIVKICWNWSKKLRYSYGNFEYLKDGVNWVGGEAGRRWGDIVEWNNPYSKLQKDEFHPLIEFASCRFRDDGLDEDVLTFWEPSPMIGGAIKANKNVLLMNSQTSYTPMLLIWDPATGVDNAKVDPTAVYFPNFPNGTDFQQFVGLNEFYNYPFWFTAGYPNTLYTNFWEIENPRISGYQGFDYEAEIEWDCATLSAIDLDGMVKTSRGNAKITQISVNFRENKLIITGSI